MPRRCMRGLTREQEGSKCCYLSWLEQQHLLIRDGSTFCRWLSLRVECMESYLSRRGEELVCCGACTQCWYVCTDMLLDILFNTKTAPPTVETDIAALDDVMLALVRARRGNPLCDEFFLPKCLAHLSLP